MNPYTENTNQLKAFFRKPIVLIASIFSFIAVIASSVIDSIPALQIKDDTFLKTFSSDLSKLAEKYNLGEGSIDAEYSGSLSFFSVLIPVAFLLFFIMARSEKGSLKAPLIVFKTNAVMMVVLSIILAVFLLLFGVLVIAEGFSYGAVALFAACGFAAFILLYSFAQLFFVNSIVKSCGSIYIVKSESALIFAATSIVSCTISITIQLYFTLRISGDQTAPLAAGWCSTILSCAGQVLVAVVVLKYYFYVREITEDLVIEPQGDVEPENDLPYQGVKGVGSGVKKCAKCGKPLGEDDYFCNYCGTTVEK